MNFKLVSDIVRTLITTIQNTATASVIALKKHTFKVHVDNPVKKVDVKGTVIVSNQIKLESKLKELKQAVIKLTTTTQGLNKKKYDVEVLNVPTELKVNNLEIVSGEITKTTSAIETLDKSVQALHKPLKELQSITVTNQPVDELEDIADTLGKLIEAVNKLKLDPKIEVTTPKLDPIVVPAPQVSLDTEKIDYDKLAQIFTYPEFDYQRLAKLLTEKMSSLVITGGGSGGSKYMFASSDGTKMQALVDASGKVYMAEADPLAEYNICDEDTADAIKYHGFTTKTGAWYILEENTNVESYRYTKGSDNYINAWANRDSLTYDYYYNTF